VNLAIFLAVDQDSGPAQEALASVR